MLKWDMRSDRHLSFLAHCEEICGFEIQNPVNSCLRSDVTLLS